MRGGGSNYCLIDVGIKSQEGLTRYWYSPQIDLWPHTWHDLQRCCMGLSGTPTMSSRHNVFEYVHVGLFLPSLIHFAQQKQELILDACIEQKNENSHNTMEALCQPPSPTASHCRAPYPL